MTAIALLLALAWAVMALAPATPIGHGLRRWLVEAPARRLAGVRRSSIVAVLLTIGLVATAWAVDDELPRVLAMAAPEAATWLSMVELGTFVDIAVTALAAQAAIKLGALRIGAWRMMAPRRHRTGRTARRHRAVPANDQDDPVPAAWRDVRRAAGAISASSRAAR